MSGMPEGRPRNVGGGRLHRSYPLRHWVGALSLARSFWLNGVLATLILFPLALFVFAWIIAWAVEHKSLFLAAAAVMALLLLPWPFLVWQLVGIWRAARRTSRVRNRRLGPLLARAAVLVWGIAGFTISGMVMAERLPLVGELARAASGDPERGERRYAVALGGRELIVSGPVAIGSVEEIEAQLARHPQVETIRLEGPGGRIAPARELRDMVRARGLSTYTAHACVSACTFIFLGGKERILKAGARLGFHRPGLSGMTDDELDIQVEQESEAMREAGIAAWFIERAGRTPHEEIWFPTADELIEAGVVTRLTDGREFGLNPLDVDGLETALRDIPQIAALKEKSPEAHKSLLRKARALILRGEPEAALQALVQKVLREQLAEAAS